ncbi:DNA-directed RNA polymerase subunit beta' [Desulfococcaceae bacterium HSG7]|nr:DNA-directed RNA polymerase subunit beta' [Desulfococcaceae bacterium HSG7]
METVYDFFAKPTNPKLYDSVQVALASPETILQWSHGEIKKPETINYRTFKPERDGLFCAKIFGPTKDYECNCGKYKRMKHRGVICEKCGVEVIQSKVRRERMAHIELATPCAHIWFLKSLPSKICNLLDISLKNVEKVLYFDCYIVLDPKETDLNYGQLLSPEQYQDALDRYGPAFEYGIGAEAIQEMLSRIDLETEYKNLKTDIKKTGSVAKRQKFAKRLKIIDAFRRSEVDPTWMILEVIPVLPPDLRPLVPLEGGRFATSDLNDLYRRVINRNNRLKRLIELKAPDIIVRNEKRMLQEAVDVLFDNGRHGRTITGTNKRPLKSLSDTLKGKQGRFRQNLLGKRVDYSGRTVVTVGPELRLHQCGLPKKIALELFKPFVYYLLEKKGLVSTVKSAKRMVEREEPEVWDTLDEVVREYPVMLNRAPTLHRLGFQAFEPILIEGKAMQLHPLVCTAFNADFDGDQMAIHIPLSVEAQIEARILMLSSNNILSPANGSPIIVPSQDIVLGTYYMTRSVRNARGSGKLFADFDEVRSAYNSGVADLHAAIRVRIKDEIVETTVGRILLWEIIPENNILKLKHIVTSDRDVAREISERLNAGENFDDLAAELSNLSTSSLNEASQEPDSLILKEEEQKEKDEESSHNNPNGLIGWLNKDEFIERFGDRKAEAETIFALPVNGISCEVFVDNAWHIFKIIDKRSGMPFEIVNKIQDKGAIRKLIDYAYRNLGPKATVMMADRLKNIGYHYSTEGGLSISIDAMIVPPSKWKICRAAETQVVKIDAQYNDGLITPGEKYNKVVDIWAKATDEVAEAMMDSMKTVRVKDEHGNQLTDENGRPVYEESFNPIYMMAESGARGSKDQMRQLAGMRGLMAKPSGEIIETPIQANFREGLSVLQYFISTHGARKGLADTALKTANSGYLTRRLADVSQDCTILEENCGTQRGIKVEPLMEGGEIIQRLGDRILGRVANEDIRDPYTDECLVNNGGAIDEDAVEKIENANIASVKIRSALTCQTDNGVCATCYGRDLAHGATIEIGQAVGILAAQSIGEPGTQLTMRTFHIGGTASRRVEQADIKARSEGTIQFIDLQTAKNDANEIVVMNRQGGDFSIISASGRERERFHVIYGAHLAVEDGDTVKSGDLLAVWDPFTTPILSEVDGIVKFGDIIDKRTMDYKVDPVTGKASRTIIESKNVDDRPRISIKDNSDETIALPRGVGMARNFLPIDAIILVDEGEMIKAGDILAKLPRATTKTKDITGGLPRVAELFEVRKPKELAVLTEIDGYVSIPKTTKKGKQKVVVTPVDEVGDKKEYLIPRGKHISVYEGDYVRAGDPLIGGSRNPQDVLNIKGEIELAQYLTDEVQEVYRLQGVQINDKHIEVIVRQMMRRVKVIDPGDTDFIAEEQVDKLKFRDVNMAVSAEGGKPAVAEPLILGITKASLSTDSFISAASFQETTKVLTEAVIASKKDYLKGLKENVIMGRIIPAGTGFPKHRELNIEWKTA